MLLYTVSKGLTIPYIFQVCLLSEVVSTKRQTHYKLGCVKKQVSVAYKDSNMNTYSADGCEYIFGILYNMT